MLSLRTWGIILIVVGLLAVVVSATADLTGLGGGGGVFGDRQRLGVIAGAVIAILGILLVVRRPKS